MSHWNHVGLRVKDGLTLVAMDPQVVKRFPSLATALVSFSDAFVEIEHALDRDLSGGWSIKSDEAFQQAALRNLSIALIGPTQEMKP